MHPATELQALEVKGRGWWSRGKKGWGWQEGQGW